MIQETYVILGWPEYQEFMERKDFDSQCPYIDFFDHNNKLGGYAIPLSMYNQVKGKNILTLSFEKSTLDRLIDSLENPNSNKDNNIMLARVLKEELEKHGYSGK